MATKTGNSYNTGTTTDSVKIPTATPGFSTMASPNKVSSSDCDNDQQPEMAMWPPQPEILISLELWQIRWKFHQQIWGFRLTTPRAKKLTPDDCETTHNWKQYRRAPNLQFRVVDRCRNHLAIFLSSSSSSKIPNLALEFRSYLWEFQRRN